MKKLLRRVGAYLGLDRKSPAYLRRSFPEATPNDIHLIRSVLPYTRTPPARLWSLLQSVRYVFNRNMDGDFVECGVWRGGSTMAAAKELKRLGDTKRTLWLYDTYEGMTQPTQHDVRFKTGKPAIEKWKAVQTGTDSSAWCDAALDDVRANIATTGYPMDKVRFVKGKVEETLRDPKNLPEKIAILRLDTDWYASTKVEMELLLPLVAQGGIVIIDDYGDWAGSKKAVDEYFAETGRVMFMHRIDKASRLFINI